MPESTDPPDVKQDPELAAIGGIVALLEPLDEDARERVVDYVFRRLGIELSSKGDPTADRVPVTPAINPVPEAPAREPAPSGSHAGRVTDIRSLTTQKNPGNAMEMAALVGYYLAHAAPKEERLEAFGTKELEKYFIQGGYPVPSAPPLCQRE
jgi:hypothetical protein